MQRASQHFTDGQRAAIAKAVAEAESKTSAEVVPVVATASGRYDRAEDIVGLWCALLAAAAMWFLLPHPTGETGDWGTAGPFWPLALLIVASIVAFVVGTIAGSKVSWLRRLFTPRRQMQEEVAARAREVFFDKRVYRTAGGTGLLVYVSLYERMAAVIADQRVLEKLGQGTLDELCTQLTTALGASHPADAICATIQCAGIRLAPVLPRAEGDVNELADALVTID
jgi:putative membrane protein